MHDDPDSDLLTAFRGGDREAFAVLVARHQGVVRAACLRQAPAAEAEDCLQAVFLVLARRPVAAAASPVLVAWLLRVAGYVCRRAQRSARRRRQAERDAVRADGAGSSHRPEALDHLDECLARLPERQRAALSLQYLAGKPTEVVAAELGVSRDNAYQLVSRGLAALRTLLARRGIVIGAPALLALLAGECQAATAAGGADACIALISATPSAHAATLANGACTAMTLTAPSTITLMAASLLLAAGVTTAVVSAEPVQIRTSGPVQPIREPAMDKDLDNLKQLQPSALQMALYQETTLDFQNTRLVDAIAFLRRDSNQNFTIDPQVAAAPHSVTLRVSKMQLYNVLAHIGRLTDTKYTIRNDAYFIQAADPVQPKPAAGIDIHEANAALHTKMQRRISFDFQDTLLTDVVDYFRQIDSENYVVMPAVAAGRTTVTLKVTEMPMQDAWKWLCQISNTSLRYVDQALVLDAASANAADPDPDLPPPVRPVNATTF